MEGLRTVTDLAVPLSSTEARVLVKGERKLPWGQKREGEPAAEVWWTAKV